MCDDFSEEPPIEFYATGKATVSHAKCDKCGAYCDDTNDYCPMCRRPIRWINSRFARRRQAHKKIDETTPIREMLLQYASKFPLTTVPNWFQFFNRIRHVTLVMDPDSSKLIALAGRLSEQPGKESMTFPGFLNWLASVYVLNPDGYMAPKKEAPSVSAPSNSSDPDWNKWNE